MRRKIDALLANWKESRTRKPLLLSGARQVGKTWALREFGKHYKNTVYINLEVNSNVADYFNDVSPALDPLRHR